MPSLPPTVYHAIVSSLAERTMKRKALSKIAEFSSRNRQFSAPSSASFTFDDDDDSPVGELFQTNKEIGPSLIGQTASIRRTFGPRSNAQVLLTCGGEHLAAHASFDPVYIRAKDWIQAHAVGPAVLSPVLISGLIGALVEAAFPFSVPDSQSMKVLRPLIVGAAVNARIEVNDVIRESEEGNRRRENGYQVDLSTHVTRVRDDTVLAEGTHSIWIPDYQRM
jgi:hypothetical protein